MRRHEVARRDVVRDEIPLDGGNLIQIRARSVEVGTDATHFGHGIALALNVAQSRNENSNQREPSHGLRYVRPSTLHVGEARTGQAAIEGCDSGVQRLREVGVVAARDACGVRKFLLPEWASG